MRSAEANQCEPRSVLLGCVAYTTSELIRDLRVLGLQSPSYNKEPSKDHVCTDQRRSDCPATEGGAHPPAPREQDRSRSARLPADAEAAQHDRAAAISDQYGTAA